LLSVRHLELPRSKNTATILILAHSRVLRVLLLTPAPASTCSPKPARGKQLSRGPGRRCIVRGRALSSYPSLSPRDYATIITTADVGYPTDMWSRPRRLVVPGSALRSPPKPMRRSKRLCLRTRRRGPTVWATRATWSFGWTRPRSTASPRCAAPARARLRTH
jgi:hypothetical protein